MKPDQFYSIEELANEWSPWDITEENLLKYGAESLIRFSIKKNTLLELMPTSVGVEFYCPFAIKNSTIPCVKANKQTAFTLSPSTLDDLRNSTEAIVSFSIECKTSCQHYIPGKPRILSHRVQYAENHRNDLYLALYDPDMDTDLRFLDIIQCKKEDLVVTKKEKERFERKYLNSKPIRPSIGKENTLLRAIGALLVANYTSRSFTNASGKYIASNIASEIIKKISENDYYDKGISSRKLEEIIPVAIEELKSNKIPQK